jgi:hypothetical protein
MSLLLENLFVGRSSRWMIMPSRVILDTTCILEYTDASGINREEQTPRFCAARSLT